MKQCPACKSVYTDASLSYCLVDGNKLDAGAGIAAAPTDDIHSEETIAMRADTDTVAVENSGATRSDIAVAGSGPRPELPSRSRGLFKGLILLGVLVFLGLIAIGAGGVALYFLSGQTPQPEKTPAGRIFSSPQSTPSTKPSEEPTTVEDELNDQIAELQRLLTDNEDPDAPAEWPLTLPGYPTATETATVNSPRDGFLALRSLPSAEIGERLARVPNGAEVTVGSCLIETKVGSRSGRWCLAKYEGKTGWVFDAYLLH